MHGSLVGFAKVIVIVAIAASALGCDRHPAAPGSEAASPHFSQVNSGNAEQGIGFDSIADLWERMDALRRAEGITACTAEISRAHRGWARADIEERYGFPSSIELDETGLLLIYTRDPKGSHDIVFTTNDGVVSTACLR